MLDSNYYNTQYKNYKNQAKEYEDNIKALTKIRNSITNDFHDEQSGVNNRLVVLKEDLDNSVRYDSRFASNANLCDESKEKAPSSDTLLQRTVDYLDSEISALNQKKTTAENNMNNSYKQYQSKKEEERQARLDAIRLG